jgi:serine/threonine protein kinase
MEKCEDGTVKPAKIMVMEYFEGGMLLQYINTGKRFTEQLVRTIFQMLLETI